MYDGVDVNVAMLVAVSVGVLGGDGVFVAVCGLEFAAAGATEIIVGQFCFRTADFLRLILLAGLKQTHPTIRLILAVAGIQHPYSLAPLDVLT